MSGFTIARGAAGAVLAAGLMAPIGLAPTARAAIEPTMAVGMTGSALSAANAGAVGCGQTAQVTLRNPDGSPVTGGTVDFVSHLAGMSGLVMGTVPVKDGNASTWWVPGVAGQHVVSAVYYNGQPQYRSVAGYTTVTVMNLGGACV